jgi:DNA-binding transcriptional ArsR family regulator
MSSEEPNGLMENQELAGHSAEDQLSLTFAALADPTRRRILARLADGEATVNELAKPFAMSVQAVSKHLKVLERAGLIKRGREAQWRPSRLEVAPLDDANQWLARYREIANDRFDRLAAEIQKLKSEGAKNK